MPWRIYDLEDIRANFNVSQLSKTNFIFYLVVLKVFSLLVPAIYDSRHKSGCGGQRVPWKWRNVDLLAAVVKKTHCKHKQLQMDLKSRLEKAFSLDKLAKKCSRSTLVLQFLSRPLTLPSWGAAYRLAHKTTLRSSDGHLRFVGSNPSNFFWHGEFL